MSKKLTPERLEEIRDRTELARLCVRDASCPPTFLAPLVAYLDDLLAEVDRLRTVNADMLSALEAIVQADDRQELDQAVIECGRRAIAEAKEV